LRAYEVVNDDEGKTAILNIRIRPSVKEAASRRAAAERRSLAAYVELVLERDAHTEIKKPKKP
jgi:predicted HicB family RNase H-like nuclease